MKLKIFLITIVLTFGSILFAQTPERFRKKGEAPAEKTPAPKTPATEEGSALKDRLVYGGNASLSFGNSTFIYIAPSVGYKFSEKLVAGPGFTYQYAKINRAYNSFTGRYQTINFENQVYGPKAFLNYFPFEDIVYVGTQYELLNHDVPLPSPNGGFGEYENRWTSVLFVEAGYVQKIGRKGFMQAGLRYNLLHDFDSPYSVALIPIISFFF